MPYPLQFDVHHIFPDELFNKLIDVSNPSLGTLGDALVGIFSGQDVGIFKDMVGNKLGLFYNPAAIANLAGLTEVGFGASPHGSH